jgi:hypothetical protein
MTLLSVVKDVCAVVGVAVPTSVMTGILANRTMQEMLALANEMAQRIAYDTRDWTLFRKTVQMVGGTGLALDPTDPVTVGCSVFAIPANYKRMLLTGNVWRSTSALYPMRFEPDLDKWLQRRALNYYGVAGEWTMIGGRMIIAPALSAAIVGPPAVPAITAYYPYLEKNCINLNAGGVGDTFVADGDSFRLDERLLKLGMVWQWKANKGTSYAEDMGTYGEALAVAMGHDSPAPIIVGRRPASAGVRTAYPFPVPT